MLEESPSSELDRFKEITEHKAARHAVAQMLIAASLTIPGVPTIEEPQPPKPPSLTEPTRHTETSATEPFKRIFMEKYAREFSDDSEAGKLTFPKELEEAANAIKARVDYGERIKYIKLQGHASDEDESVKSDAGLGKPSEKNEDLASKRASIAGKLFAYQLDEKDIPHPKIKLAKPAEDILSDDEITYVEGLTKRAREASPEIRSPHELADAYNAITDVEIPADVREALDQLLGKNRNVKLEVGFEQTTTVIADPLLILKTQRRPPSHISLNIQLRQKHTAQRIPKILLPLHQWTIIQNFRRLFLP